MCPPFCSMETGMDQERRKKLRLEQYDYSSHGAYFVTVCTHERAELFGEAGQPSEVADKMKEVFEAVLEKYTYMRCPQYVVMPNHLHALIVIEDMKNVSDKSIAEFMRSFKSQSTVEYIRMVKAGKAKPFEGKLWQRSYYDHVIRNEQDFQEVWKYIAENPLRWQLRKQREL